MTKLGHEEPPRRGGLVGVEQFLSLDMLDLLGQAIPCYGAALGIVGC